MSPSTPPTSTPAGPEQLTLTQEFRSLYRRLVAVAGIDQVQKWLALYEDAFGRRDWERFERLRAFPLFLRNENRLHRLNQPWLVDLALWEWTEFNVLYSPMDEEKERESLKTDEFLLNPTVQILRLETELIAWFDQGVGAIPPSEKSMALLYRKRDVNGGFRVAHDRAEWMTAAVLDVLLENGRTAETTLWSEIAEHHGSAEAPQVKSQWKDEINRLIDLGIILSGA